MMATTFRWIFGALTALLALLLALAGLYIGYIFSWQFTTTFYLALDPANIRPISVGALVFVPVLVAFGFGVISFLLFKGLRKKKAPTPQRSTARVEEKALVEEV